MATRKKNSKVYWQDREAQEVHVFGEIKGIIKREQAVIAQEKKIYAAALDELDKELDALRKDVGDEAITRAAVQKPMTARDLEQWSKRQQERLDNLIDQYGDEEGRKIFGMENAKTGKQDRADRVVRRQEILKKSINAIANGAAAQTETVTQKALEAEAQNGATAFQNQLPPELKATAKVDFDTVDEGTVTRTAQTLFKPEDFSERIWANRDVLVKDLERSISLAVTNGWSIPRLAKEFEHNVAVDERSAERIARTEMNRVSNAAELAQYRQNNIKYYRFIATEDARTCEICGKLHDTVHATDAATPGENFPPVHPNCRCRTVISTVDENGNEDDSWLDDMQAEIDALQDEFDEMDEKEERAQIASKTLVEDGTVSPKIDHKEAYRQIQERRTQDKAFDDFINGHVETNGWDADGHEYVPELSVLEEAHRLFDDYLSGNDTTCEISFEFGHPNDNAFNMACHRAFGDTDDEDDYRKAGGVFGIGADGRPVIVLRSTVTLDGLHHEIGHAIHSHHLDDDESKDPILTADVRSVRNSNNQKLFPYGVDRSEPLFDVPKRGFEVELLKALTGKSRFGSVDEYKTDASKYAGLLTAFHNINAIVRNSNSRGIHWGNDKSECPDSGWKELFANISTIYLSGNKKAANFLETHYRPIAEYVKTRIDKSRRRQP